MNAGGESETIPHYTLKSLMAFVAARDYGYMTDLEVNVPHGEIDCLLWGHPNRLTYACEIETSPTAEIKQEKLEKYVNAISAIDDMILINPSNISMDMVKAAKQLSQKL
jgi:sporulation protein YlmC with PRC-barrel domain